MADPVNYLGAKSATGAFQAIIAQMPPHDTYIETHFGTGAVMRNKPPAARQIAIEIDPETLATFPPPDGAEVYQCDAVPFLQTCNFDFEEYGRTLIYMDPPYLPQTRTSRHRYRFEYTVDDHIALLTLAKELPAQVMISGYPSALYDDMLSDWRKIEFQVMTRGGPRTECLWMNFDPGPVQWATFAGSNFTERQRIKRKAERWAKNYRKLDQGERLAVLAAIMDVHRDEDPT